MTARTGYAGADLPPLPFESQISVLLRLAWRNAFGLKSMKDHFSSSKHAFHLDTDRLESALCWSLPDEAPSGVPSYHGSFFSSSSFRYCLLCMEAGYHSYLHQCVQLDACPLHRIVLAETCHTCQRRTLGFDQAALLANPYQCPNCKGPLCGVPPQLDSMLDFRSSQESLGRAFRPYHDWWTKGFAARTNAIGLSKRYRPPHPFNWCETGAFVRALSSTESPPLEFLDSSTLNRKIVSLRWSQSVRLVKDFMKPCRSNFVIRTRIPTSVYRCTLRLIRRWINSDFTEACKDLIEWNPDAPGMAEYERRMAAWNFMRTQFEWFLEDPPADLRQALLSDRPEIGMPSWNSFSTSRLGWRAYFLAMYAAWYSLLGRPGFLREKGRKFPVRNASLVFFSSNLHFKASGEWSTYPNFRSDEVKVVGEVAFFSVPGMPLNPW